MYFSRQQFFFISSFFIIFLLLSLFGETVYGFGILLFLLPLFWINSRHFSTTKNTSVFVRTVSLLFILFAALSVVSLFFTVSIPLTFNKFIILIFSVVVGSFFLLIDKKWLNWDRMKPGFIFVGVTLSLLSISSTFVPTLNNYIPSLNLLFSNYGHNHVALFLLFILPIAWENWEKEQKNLFTFGLFLFFLLFIFLSFGRVLVVLAFCELLVLYWQRNKPLTQLSKIIVKSILGLFAVGAIILLLLSFLPKIFPQVGCFAPQFQMRLCKNVSEEPRPAYWLQAVEGFISKPLMGWGGGTFSVVSYQFSKHSYQFSSSAHNSILQTFSEYGILAGMIYLFLFGLLLSANVKVISIKKDKKNEAIFLSLGIFVLLINSLFDYDFDLVSVWFLLIISVSFFLSEFENELPRFSSFSNKIFLKLSSLKQLFWISSISSLLIGIFYIASSFFWLSHNYELSLKIYPFLYGRVIEKIGTSVLSPESNENLHKMYRYHPGILENLYRKSFNSAEKEVLARELLQLNHLKYLPELLESLAAQNKWQEFLQTIEHFDQNITGEYVSTSRAESLAALSVVGGNIVLERHEYELAAKLYNQARNVSSPSLSRVNVVGLRSEDFLQNQFALKMVDSWPLSDLGEYWDPMAAWYVKRFDIAAKNHDRVQILFTVKKLRELGPEFEGRICSTIPELCVSQ